MATTPADVSPLSKEEVLRYSRHLIMPEVGMEGQEKLKAARVLCIGTGGLGSPLALYLAAAGVGTLGLVDFDVVDFKIHQPQSAYSGGGQVKGERRAESPSTDAEYAGGLEFLLPLHTNFRHDQVAGITQYFLFR